MNNDYDNKNDNGNHNKQDCNQPLPFGRPPTMEECEEARKRLEKSNPAALKLIDAMFADPEKRFRRLVVAWNRICDDATLSDDDKSAVCRVVCDLGEENGWIEWDDSRQDYIYVPEGIPLAEVR